MDGPVSRSVGDSIALFISSVLPGKHLAAEIFPEWAELYWVLQLFCTHEKKPQLPAQALSQAVLAVCGTCCSSGESDRLCFCWAELKSLIAWDA